MVPSPRELPDLHIPALRLKLAHLAPGSSSAQFQHPHAQGFICVCAGLVPQHPGLPRPPVPVLAPWLSRLFPTHRQSSCRRSSEISPAPEISNAAVVFHGVFIKQKTKNPASILGKTPKQLSARTAALVRRSALPWHEERCPCTDGNFAAGLSPRCALPSPPRSSPVSGVSGVSGGVPGVSGAVRGCPGVKSLRPAGRQRPGSQCRAGTARYPG